MSNWNRDFRNPKALPSHIYPLMTPQDRASLGKHARTREEIERDNEADGEKALQRMVADYLRVRDIYYIQQPMHKRSQIRPGAPDFHCCHKGRFIALECKWGAGKQTDEQRDCETQIQACGGAYYVIRALDEVKRILDGV